MFIYSIRCEFGGDGTDGDADLVNRWLAWMRATHILEVLRSGALSAELIRIDTERSCFVVNYQFESAITSFCSPEQVIRCSKYPRTQRNHGVCIWVITEDCVRTEIRRRIGKIDGRCLDVRFN